MSLRDTYEDLKKKYAFNPGNLKDRFLDVADTIFYSSNAYMKQYNLLLFRMNNPNLPLPELFYSFSFDDSQNMGTDETLRDYIKNSYKSEDENISKLSITQILQEGFEFKTPASKLKLSPKVQFFTPKDRQIIDDKEIAQAPEIQFPFVIDYFCTTTFPAVFAHFISNEYLLIGYKFIKKHINDKLAPRLVGTYLLHNNLFKDRFFNTFFTAVIGPLFSKSDAEESNFTETDDEFPDDQEEDLERIFKNKSYLSKQNLLKLLYDSFSKCIGYFSEHHPKVVNLLRETDEQGAILAITNYFLKEIISLWKYSPISNYTSIFNKTQTIKNPEFYNEIFRHNILDDLAQSVCSNKAFALKILDLFGDDSLCYTEYPDIFSMKYFNGVSCCVSMADMKIMQCIIYAEKAENTGKKVEFKKVENVRDFINQMFLFRNSFKQYLTPGFNEPTSKVLSTELSEEKLKENQKFLNFIIDRMKGMKLIQMCMDSDLEILKLKERQYASKLWNSPLKVNSSYFCHKMFVQFCWTIFTGQVNYNETHVKALIENEEEFYSYFINSIDVNRFSKTPVNKYLFDQVSNYYRMLRLKIDPLKTEVYFNENMVESSKYLTSEILRVTFELLVNMLNETPYQFIEASISEDSTKSLETYRNEKLQKFISKNTFQVEENTEDDFDVVIRSADLMRTIITLADDEMKNEIDRWVIEKFRIGDKLLLFLMLKELIEKSLEKTDFKELKYYSSCILRNGDYDYDYFRANLINCINVFTSLFAKSRCFLPLPEIIDSLNYLKIAFNIKDGVK